MNEPTTDNRRIGRNDFLHGAPRLHLYVTSKVDDEGKKVYEARRSDGTLIEGCETEDEQDTIRLARNMVHEEIKKA